MSRTMRKKDAKLVEILRDELQEFIPLSISESNLKNTVRVLLNYMRKNSRTCTNVVYIDTVSYWNETEEFFYYKNKVILLTPQEQQLLSLLFKNLNTSISYSSIAIELWGMMTIGSHGRIKTIIKQLRKKLPKKIIKNIFSYGYKIEIYK